MIVAGVTFISFLLCKIYLFFSVKLNIVKVNFTYTNVHCSNIYIFINFCHVLWYVVNCRERVFIMLLYLVPNTIADIRAIKYA